VILLHRISVYLILASILAVFVIAGQQLINLSWLIGIFLLIVLFLLARLLGYDWRSPSFWIFFLSPLALFLSALLFLFFLETASAIWFVTVVTVSILFIYLENIFTFYYLPANYQPYALEHISLALYLVFMFFIGSGFYAMKLFLLLPFWLPTIAVFALSLLACIAMFWVSKINIESSVVYAVAGAIAMSQFYLSVGMLPTGFIVSGSIFATLFYMYLGLSRAHVLEKLNREVLMRYVVTGIVFISIIMLTAQWS
jgi:hypothetical protein